MGVLVTSVEVSEESETVAVAAALRRTTADGLYDVVACEQPQVVLIHPVEKRQDENGRWSIRQRVTIEPVDALHWLRRRQLMRLAAATCRSPRVRATILWTLALFASGWAERRFLKNAGLPETLQMHP